MFLYSQDLSNYKTTGDSEVLGDGFLYSQDLSNYKTQPKFSIFYFLFLYSQDLSNYKTNVSLFSPCIHVFVLSRFK